jgi:hypothetical protein
MALRRTFVVLVATVALVASCGDDDNGTGDDTTTTTTTVDTTTTTEAAELAQPAVWPAADVVFETPEDAAEDFVTQVLGVPATLGEFEQGDARSGEIDVLFPGEGNGEMAIVRSRLLLRQLGPDDGWFVLAAVNENASITAPDPMAEVAAGALTVEGSARGFEANVVVTAFVAGDAEAQLDEQITQGGALETPEPFTVTVDLSGAAPGEVVTLLVRGGTGLETDTGEFSAIPVVIAG